MKKLLCSALALLLLVSLTFIPSAADTTVSVDGVSCGNSYHYKDAYFTSNASVYNPSLSTMSFCLALSGSASSYNNWTAQYRHLYALFAELGFTDLAVNDDFMVYPTTDSMGVGMAHKTISAGGKTYTLLAIVPRSCNYEAEWASNFTVGKTGDAAGFSSAANKVQTFAEQYVAQYGNNFTGELKLWIVGYSRGAAVANLVAGRITTAGKVGSFTVAKENIYGYTFETPRGLSTEVVSVETAKTYTNIHNIISSNDLVTKVAPADFGFIRYGTDESVIPETRDASNKAFFNKALAYLPEYLAAYNTNSTRIFASEQFQAKKITSDITALSKLGSWQKVDGVYTWVAVDSATAKSVLVVNSDKTMGAFLDDLLKALTIAVGNRENYTDDLQDLIRLIMSETLGSNYQTQILTVAKASLIEKLQANKETILVAALTGKEIYLTDILNKIVNEVIDESGLDAEAYGNLPQQLLGLVPTAVRIVMADVVIDGGSDVLTLIDNLDILFNPHYSEQCMAWLMAQDKNYSADAEVFNAAVTDVTVTVTKKTTTKKILFIKVTETRYDVTISPVSAVAVSDVSYRTLLIGKLKSGTSFTKDIKPTYIYIAVTDANGNVTHWEYKNGTVKQVN